MHHFLQGGGLKPLLDLLDSRNGNLQHNAAFALYGLADNEDNIGDMVREGAVQRLQACDLIVQVLVEGRMQLLGLEHILGSSLKDVWV